MSDRTSQLRNAGGGLAKGAGSTMQGFKDFLMRGNLIELATAVILGTAFTAVVKAFTDILWQIIGKFGGVPDFTNKLVFGLSLGAFLSAVLSFILVAAVMYFLVITPYNKVRARNQQTEEAAPAVTSEDLLTEIRDLLARQSGQEPPAHP